VADREQRTPEQDQRRAEQHGQRSEGPSPGSEMDRMATSAPKSDWVEPTAPAAGDPVTEDERRGLDLLGHESERGGAIPGVSGMNDAEDEKTS